MFIYLCYTDPYAVLQQRNVSVMLLSPCKMLKHSLTTEWEAISYPGVDCFLIILQQFSKINGLELIAFGYVS